MDPNRLSLRQQSLFFILTALWALCATAESDVPDDSERDWTQVVRSSPYWVSQGVYTNILTIRDWVLRESGYCSESDRHILFDMRGQFLAWLSDKATREATQAQLNDTRRSLHQDERVDTWVPGGKGQTGYPFALSCDQPHVDLDRALARYLGRAPAYRLWGAWDDLAFASSAEPGSLHDALNYVYSTRAEQQRINLAPGLLPHLAGQILIESGGQQRAHSAADARGIMQLSPTALSDCQIRPKNYWHRLAQIDCALRLTNQNARNLRPAFNERFGHLPEQKRERLFNLLLIQAYHGGAGRVTSLLTDPQLGKPADYFATHHGRFSAGDIAFGMVFHNLGRDRLGLASLYYVADVELAMEALCKTPEITETDFCAWK
ncbi:lytic transglycosylase domain-containing protein [Marinobacter sp. F4216]|uniref:lytic transglycosylase domain-containing protein n=1 Tax=Marinobacter sp. F4216 TaxID=2874281 RepID=UPI001CBAEFF9|nr:lytic transglycosylase domain-containing protein [Marinobacter sp. F4216]MBZ2169707.1 lytic transglycosylase domain-containing protein [Marinobacter sp. F4216]